MTDYSSKYSQSYYLSERGKRWEPGDLIGDCDAEITFNGPGEVEMAFPGVAGHPLLRKEESFVVEDDEKDLGEYRIEWIGNDAWGTIIARCQRIW